VKCKLEHCLEWNIEECRPMILETVL